MYGNSESDGTMLNTLLKREDLAALSGMTKQVSSRTITVFEKQGTISVKGKKR